MQYFYSVQDTHNYIHSIDNCVVSYFLKTSLKFALDYLHKKGSGRVTYYENTGKSACTKYNFFQNHIHYDDGIYLKLGKYKVLLENKKKFELLSIIQIEVNPNKHYEKDSFREILDFIKEYCTSGYLVRYDYAIDIPCSLDDVQVFGSRKEKGLYKGTRYFGQRNKHGFCKIYDKGKEQKLASKLTRIEHTLSGCSPLSLESFFVRSDVSALGLDSLSNSTRTIVLLCLEIKQLGGDYSSIIDSMNFKTKKQVLEHIDGGYSEYVYDKEIVNKLLDNISKTFYLDVYEDANGFMQLSGLDELPFD